MHNVLILDANQRSALGAVRSLGRRGLRVIAADHHLPSIGTVSKHAAGAEQYADPTTSPQAFLRDITAIVHRLAIDVVMPMTDTTTMLLVERPDLVGAGTPRLPFRLELPGAHRQRPSRKAGRGARGCRFRAPSRHNRTADPCRGGGHRLSTRVETRAFALSQGRTHRGDRRAYGARRSRAARLRRQYRLARRYPLPRAGIRR